ncbi:hypothetical protein ABBQ32_006567 [Trebouxia sp. C0010 RCD-2024]
MTHDCVWYRSPYPWTGVDPKPEDVADYYCLVFYWNPLVQFFHVHGVPLKPACPDCESTIGVEGAGMSDTLRHIFSTQAYPGAMAGKRIPEQIELSFMDETVSVCRSGIDRADVEASRSMLWRLETSKQVAAFNEQKRTAYINLEYCM